MTGDYQTERRMALKRQAIPLPGFAGKRVLDVGTDHGYWAFLAAEMGARDVLGLDRNRKVQGVETDLIRLNADEAKRRGSVARFERINLGKEWREFGQFDVAFVLSVYHHIFEACGDHRPIWFWLARHTEEVIWEGPIDDSDPVVRANVSDQNRKGYTLDAILGAAARYFYAEKIGPALHEPTREVWRFRRRRAVERLSSGTAQKGAGGATRAFEYAGGRRIAEIETVLGWRPVPGSLNVSLDAPFDWDGGFYRVQILDVADRSAGLASVWASRWARFYPLTVDGVSAAAFRFEGERYPQTFVEIIAPTRLRDHVGNRVTVCRPN